MSCFGVKKPLHPAKKAWNRLAATVETKLHKLRRSTPITAILPALAQSPYHPRSRKGRTGFHARKLSHCQSFAPVYIDELFSNPVAVHVEPPVRDGGVKEDAEKIAKLDHEMIVGSSSSSSFAFGSSSSHGIGELGEVDMRAEMFIAKFKEEMRLERQRSFGEYQEMLARGL